VESNRNFFSQPSEKLDSRAGPFTIDEYLFIKMDKYASTVKMRQSELRTVSIQALS
jgi:hypothetical protein